MFGLERTKVQVDSHIEPSANAQTAMRSPYFMKKKILCQVWSNDLGMFKIVATKKVSYGSVDFTINTGRRTKRRFQIRYDELKQGKKMFIYDVAFDNALGTLAFHEYKEKVDSKQAETMLQDGAVDFFIAKGGIPLFYLLIMMIGMVVCAGALAIIAPQYVQAVNDNNALVKQVQSLSATITQLHNTVTGH